MNAPKREPLRGETPADERSVGDLFRELADETGALIRQEVKLATTEMSKKATDAAMQVAWIAVGALFGIVSLLTLLGALVLALGTLMALWQAALLVGIASGITAGALALKGITSLRKLDPMPRQTIQSIRENKSWVQQQVR